ncbi:MAG: glycosyltransferase family 2 protein [Flavobacteriales bacterium]|jgi:glycosyltransferase involved in cell wall biosynthesis|nr:glycosyltransferase family 2 protein [Flavobacteriales bacterium]
MKTIIDVIIPAFNEEQSINHVIKDIPENVRDIIVVNNGSTDQTPFVAKNAGATVLTEKKMGYGHACLKGMAFIADKEIKPDIVVFLDGDYSDYPEELTDLVTPIVEKKVDFVIGNRNTDQRQKSAMTPQQVFGNWLATTLMKWFFGSTFSDLGPFRAIKYATLLDLQMQDKTYGWTVEMQLKILKKKIAYTEIPVKYRMRIGESKVSGTLKGTILAGYKILLWIFKYSFKS